MNYCEAPARFVIYFVVAAHCLEMLVIILIKFLCKYLLKINFILKLFLILFGCHVGSPHTPIIPHPKK